MYGDEPFGAVSEKQEAFVFPVCTGMNRTARYYNTEEVRVPRVYGDEPEYCDLVTSELKCSPCVRG